jgi:hypothetical protein
MASDELKLTKKNDGGKFFHKRFGFYVNNFEKKET